MMTKAEQVNTNGTKKNDCVLEAKAKLQLLKDDAIKASKMYVADKMAKSKDKVRMKLLDASTFAWSQYTAYKRILHSEFPEENDFVSRIEKPNCHVAYSPNILPLPRLLGLKEKVVIREGPVYYYIGLFVKHTDQRLKTLDHWYGDYCQWMHLTLAREYLEFIHAKMRVKSVTKPSWTHIKRWLLKYKHSSMYKFNRINAAMIGA